MDVYRWRCPKCGYEHNEPGGTSKIDAIKYKQQHIKFCGTYGWKKKYEIEDKFKQIRVIEV